MLGRTALVAAVATTLGIAACVSDDPVDLNAAKDAGSAPSTTSGAANAGGLLCGLITEGAFPSCPGTGPNDPSCNTDDTKPACCPGLACAKTGEACPAPATSKPYECFAGAHCNDASNGAYENRCCAEGTLAEDPAKNGCNLPLRLTMSASESTHCSPSCSNVQICRPGDGRDTCAKGTCQATIIAIPNPKGGEPFLRKVGVCR